MAVCNIGSKPGGILKHTEEPNPLKSRSSLQSVLNARIKHSNVIYKIRALRQTARPVELAKTLHDA